MKNHAFALIAAAGLSGCLPDGCAPDVVVNLTAVGDNGRDSVVTLDESLAGKLSSAVSCTSDAADDEIVGLADSFFSGCDALGPVPLSQHICDTEADLPYTSLSRMADRPPWGVVLYRRVEVEEGADFDARFGEVLACGEAFTEVSRLGETCSPDREPSDCPENMFCESGDSGDPVCVPG